MFTCVSHLVLKYEYFLWCPRNVCHYWPVLLISICDNDPLVCDNDPLVCDNNPLVCDNVSTCLKLFITSHKHRTVIELPQTIVYSVVQQLCTVNSVVQQLCTEYGSEVVTNFRPNHQQICEVYGNNSVTDNMVRNWARMFNEG